jgi:hypothetical protein
MCAASMLSGHGTPSRQLTEVDPSQAASELERTNSSMCRMHAAPVQCSCPQAAAGGVQATLALHGAHCQTALLDQVRSQSLQASCIVNICAKCRARNSWSTV